MVFSRLFLCFIGAFTLTCSTKSPNEWKSSWVSSAFILNNVNTKTQEQKKQLLNLFKQEISKLQHFQSMPQQAQKLKESGYSKKWKIGKLGGTYSNKTLHELEVFLQELTIFLETCMNQSWKQALKNSKKFKNYTSDRYEKYSKFIEVLEDLSELTTWIPTEWKTSLPL